MLLTQACRSKTAGLLAMLKSSVATGLPWGSVATQRDNGIDGLSVPIFSNRFTFLKIQKPILGNFERVSIHSIQIYVFMLLFAYVGQSCPTVG